MPERVLNERLVEFGTTIFAEMSALALATGAINLGQGFPDTDGPREVADAAVAAIRAGHNQYPPGLGIADLRLAVAEHQKRFYDLDFDPDTEVLITAGATEAIAAVMLSLLEPGDEVVLFEPYYDSHIAGIAMAGAERRLVTLRPPHYRFDPDELAAAIGPRTRMIVVNSPHNPTGKVFDREELEFIAELCREHDLLAVTDEVYEHLAYDGEHIPLVSLPGMRERTISVSSGGKTFSFTGWKIGWVCAKPELRDAVTAAKQFLTFVNGAPFQHAIAVGLRLGDDYFDGLRANLMARRDQLSDGLAAAGFEVYRPAGTYFVTADVRPLGFDDGMALCRKLPELCGVVAVPSVVFYDNEDEGRHLVRFAFCKRPEVLDEAVERLAKLGTGS
ncbi:pyridoxal phosphate-dependent aminotransferase [Candidatus Poriferisocius sp.]|uniref:pyridoxal phosphate-dependent aminotransferase n=1 Tax=Candidatus Poriferisocius sp. TaxID=3101276 RepID=UPI003B5B306F